MIRGWREGGARLSSGHVYGASGSVQVAAEPRYALDWTTEYGGGLARNQKYATKYLPPVLELGPAPSVCVRCIAIQRGIMGHALSCLTPAASSFPSDAQSIARELRALARDGNQHRFEVRVARDMYSWLSVSRRDGRRRRTPMIWRHAVWVSVAHRVYHSPSLTLVGAR